MRVQSNTITSGYPRIGVDDWVGFVGEVVSPSGRSGTLASINPVPIRSLVNFLYQHYSMQPTHNDLLSQPVSRQPVDRGAPIDDVLAGSIPASVEAELDDLIARAETFVGEGMSDEPDDYLDHDHDLDRELFKKTAPQYMHGVVRGQQAYLTTNLLESSSLMLLQPQMVWTLGRNREAGIPIRDRMLSRRHASIIYLREDRAFFLLDLNSMNGSYVNGVRVDQQRLKDGDLVRIGNTEFFFFVSEHYENLEPLHADVHAKLLSALLRENTIIE